MADNIAVDAGTGPSVATDDCGAGGHVQLVKLAYSADGVATLVTADANGVLVDLGANNDVTVTGSVAVTNAGLTELAAAINASSQMDVNIAASGATVPVSGTFWQATQPVSGTFWQATQPVSGTFWQATQPVSGTFWQTTQPVSLASVPSHAVTNAGTFATQVDGAALTALQLIDDPITADDAAFTIGTSKVMVTGGAVVAHNANPDAADAGDAGAPIMNRHRVPFVIGGHPNQKTCTYLWTAATTDDNIMAAIASGTKYVVTRLTFTLDEATTVGVAARVGFGTANVPALPAANADAVDDILFYHPGMVPGTMHTVGDGIGILGVGGDGAELRITAEATTGGTGVVCVTYYTIES